jgi:hypothetical protein
MTIFEWFGPTGRGNYGYTYKEDDEGYSRAMGIASVYRDGDYYRVNVSYHLDAVLPSNSYILKKKYATVDAAKRAVERKIPGLIAVLKISGGIEI